MLANLLSTTTRNYHFSVTSDFCCLGMVYNLYCKLQTLKYHQSCKSNEIEMKNKQMSKVLT